MREGWKGGNYYTSERLRLFTGFPMHYTVAYDITDDKRRNKVAKILKDFGSRIQYSVFECNTDRRALLRLRSRLEKVIDFSEDTITFYHLCAACEKQIDRIGLKKGLDNHSYIV